MIENANFSHRIPFNSHDNQGKNWRGVVGIGQKSWVGRFLIPLGLIRVNVIGIICRLTSLLV